MNMIDYIVRKDIQYKLSLTLNLSGLVSYTRLYFFTFI